MYLSDLLVAANKEGGRDCVKQMVGALTRLPDDWWNVRGCRNWLNVAIRYLQEDEETFFSKLDEYEERDWPKAKPLDGKLKE